MIVKLLKDTFILGRVHMAGQSYDFDKETVSKLVESGAVILDEKEQEPPAPAPAKKKKSK
jgi:hypothetical protein